MNLGSALQDPAQHHKYLPAFHHLFEDMVLEEAYMGMLMTQTGHVVVRRTGLNTFVYSPVIKPEQLPLSLLALMRGCYLYAAEEAHLKRELVPITPEEGWSQPLQHWPKAKRKRPSQSAKSPFGKRSKSAGNQRGQQLGSEQQVLMADCLKSCSRQGHSVMRSALPLFTPGVAPSSLVSVGFDMVGLTGRVHSKTRRATVAEVRNTCLLFMKGGSPKVGLHASSNHTI